MTEAEKAELGAARDRIIAKQRAGCKPEALLTAGKGVVKRHPLQGQLELENTKPSSAGLSTGPMVNLLAAG